MVKAQQITLKVISAELKTDNDNIGKQDPYCNIKLGDQSFRTGTKDDAGKNPVWEEIFTLVKFDASILQFRLMEDDKISSDDILANGELNLDQVLNQNKEFKIDLLSEEGKTEGFLKIELTWGEPYQMITHSLKINVKKVDFKSAEIKTDHDKIYIKVNLEKMDMTSKKSYKPKKGVAKVKETFDLGMVSYQQNFKLSIFDKDTFSNDDNIGSCLVSISQLQMLNSGDPLDVNTIYKDQISSIVSLEVEHDYEEEKIKEGPLKVESPRNADTKNVNDSMMSNVSLNKSRMQRSFLPQKRKVKVSAMDEEEKMEYAKELEENYKKLRDHNDLLSMNLDKLRNKHNDTLARMLEKKKVAQEPTERETELQKNINRSYKSLRVLQQKTTRLRNKVSGSSGFEIMKDLENEVVSRTSTIDKIRDEISLIQKIQRQNDHDNHSYQNENQHVMKQDKLTMENNQLKEELKNKQQGLKFVEEKTKSVSNAFLVLERAFRNTCIENNIDDKLGVKIDGETDEINFSEFNPSKRKLKIKSKTDPRLKNPIFLAIHKQKQADMENDNEDELRNLEMNEQSFQTLLGEWQRILDEKQQRKIELQEKESYVKEIIPVVDNLNERLKDKQNLCRLINSKIREFRRIKQEEDKKKERAYKKRMKGVEEEWQTQFVTPKPSEQHTEVEKSSSESEDKENSSSEDSDSSDSNSDSGPQANSEAKKKEKSKVDESSSENSGDDKTKEKKENDDTTSKNNKEMKSEKSSKDKESEDEQIDEMSRTSKKRTEIILGLRYNKAFEVLFDDRVVFGRDLPKKIVRIKAHYDKENLLTYMGKKGDIFKGKLNGNRRVKSYGLKVQEFEIGYSEQFVRVRSCYSKGIHWIKLFTNKGRELHLGPEIQTPDKAEENDLILSENEKISFMSGGFSGKSYRFTYVAFHIRELTEEEKNESEPQFENQNQEEDYDNQGDDNYDGQYQQQQYQNEGYNNQNNFRQEEEIEYQVNNNQNGQGNGNMDDNDDDGEFQNSF